MNSGTIRLDMESFEMYFIFCTILFRFLNLERTVFTTVPEFTTMNIKFHNMISEQNMGKSLTYNAKSRLLKV